MTQHSEVNTKGYGILILFNQIEKPIGPRALLQGLPGQEVNEKFIAVIDFKNKLKQTITW